MTVMQIYVPRDHAWDFPLAKGQSVADEFQNDDGDFEVTVDLGVCGFPNEAQFTYLETHGLGWSFVPPSDLADFQSVADYVLAKNHDLYQRLADHDTGKVDNNDEDLG